MLLYEFRIPLPMSLKEYQIGQLFSTAELCLKESGGGEGVEVLTNEPFTDTPMRLLGYNSGTYTYKIYHMESKIPSFVKLLIDTGRLDVHEEAWNAFPLCKTILTNPGYMKKNFSIVIESFHVENDRGLLDNPLNLSQEELEMRQIVHIDIGNDPFTSKGEIDSDPSQCSSKKAKRGPLRGNWISECSPVMTAYKLVRAEFKWFGLQKKVENWIQVNEHRLFTNFHRQLFCWMDRWYGMTMLDIRKMEAEYKEAMKNEMLKGNRKGADGSTASTSVDVLLKERKS